MCGIAGFISLNHPIDHPKSHLDSALQKLKKRGPDHTEHRIINNLNFIDFNLSIILLKYNE